MANLLMLRSAAVPVGWVLPYLLLGYGVISLGISVTAKRAGLWLLISFVLAQHQAFLLNWGDYYSSLAAWSLAYSVGAVAYWLGFAVPRDTGWGSVARDISFPVFLSHWLIIAAISLPPGWPLFVASLPPTIALSWILVVAVERPISRYRQRFKSSTP
jgi:peptidoglycan/LPS O-acetylase OafA/YrhL